MIDERAVDCGALTINSDALHGELMAAFGAAVTGVSTAKGRVLVNFLVAPGAEQIDQARALVAAHDPLALTAAQQAERDRKEAEGAARDGALAALAAYSAAMLDLTDNWAELTAGARLEAVRVGVIVALRMARWLVARALG